MSKKVCLITGVGPGTGASLARRFMRGGYQIAMLARDKERLRKLEGEIEHSKGFVCDVSDEAAVTNVVDSVVSELGQPEILIHNAVGAVFGNFMEIAPADLNSNFQTYELRRLNLNSGSRSSSSGAGECVSLSASGSGVIRSWADCRFVGLLPCVVAIPPMSLPPMCCHPTNEPPSYVWRRVGRAAARRRSSLAGRCRRRLGWW